MDNNMKEKQIKRQITDVLISGYSSKKIQMKMIIILNNLLFLIIILLRLTK